MKYGWRNSKKFDVMKVHKVEFNGFKMFFIPCGWRIVYLDDIDCIEYSTMIYDSELNNIFDLMKTKGLM